MLVIARYILVLTLIVLPLTAQQTTATLVGSITDASGALMPNVTVRATNLSTNAQRDTKSDDTAPTAYPFSPPATTR